jgi:hypothetical protein
MILHQDKDPEGIMKRNLGTENSVGLAKTVVGSIKIEQLTGKKSAEIDY